MYGFTVLNVQYSLPVSFRNISRLRNRLPTKCIWGIQFTFSKVHTSAKSSICYFFFQMIFSAILYVRVFICLLFGQIVHTVQPVKSRTSSLEVMSFRPQHRIYRSLANKRLVLVMVNQGTAKITGCRYFYDLLLKRSSPSPLLSLFRLQPTVRSPVHCCSFV